jgi:photosystem II stability/assembly factor-like uncharacterized protein
MPRFLIFLFLICLSTSASAQWRCANTYKANINDIFFADRQTIFACGQSIGLGSCSGTNSILRSIDGGETWVRMNTGSNGAMNRLHFVDTFTGWAVGATSTVIKTTDGGQTWVTQTSGVGAGYNDIHFPTSQTGYVVGANGIVRKSTNGGSTWTTIASGSGTLNAVWFVNANLGYYVGSNGAVFKTTNGNSFSSVYAGTNELFRDVWFQDNNRGYVMSNNKLLKTENGGSSWTTINAEAGQTWLRMNWVNFTTGFIFGDSGLILKTSDAGETWQTLTNQFDVTNYCGYFIDENTGFIGSELGKITKTSDGGQTWTNIHSGIDRQYGIAFRTPELGLYCGANGYIYRTTNGSLSHRRILIGNDKFYSAVRWMDDEVALACGESGSIIRSTDAGLTWTEITTDTTAFLNDLWSVNELVAYACGENGTVVKTSDAGLTWQVQHIPDTDLYLRGVHFLNPLQGMVVGNNFVYRTLNGGATWELKNAQISINTSLNDVWVANDTIAYAAGGFGKFYRSLDGGDIWEGIWPTSNTNADIDEMIFINDTVGYFARFNSQSITLNGGLLIGSQSTYCLANNGGVDAIEVIERNGKVYGACTGGISNVLHTVSPDSLRAVYLQDSVFCSGSRLFVGYFATGDLYFDNIITAQLSNASGSFANPVDIGSYTITNPTVSPSNIITCTLPAGLNGNGYRIRVICNNPQLISPDNGYNIRITNSIAPQLQLSANPPAACSGQVVTLSASTQSAGSNPAYSWQINGTPITWEAPVLLLDTLSSATQVVLSLTSSLACASPLTRTDTVDLAIAASPIANAGQDTGACFPETVQIGSPSSESIIWTPANGLDNPEIAQPIVSVEEDVLYVVTVTNKAGCSSTDSVLVLLYETPVLPEIELSGAELVLVPPADPALSITWFLDNEPIEDAGNDTLTVFATGLYTARLESTQGCSVLSAPFEISTVRNSATQLSGIIARTVPGAWVIEGYENNTGLISYHLFDVSGKLAASGQIHTEQELMISNYMLVPGIYMLRIDTDSSNTYNTKLIKIE